MNPAERLIQLLSGHAVDRPPFIPAIYDLKPAFLNRPSHTFGQTEQDLIDALTFEVKELHADALTVGYDIYNVEAEAVGCRIRREPNIWMPEIAEALIREPGEIKRFEVPEEPSGRMGLFVRAAEVLLEQYGAQIPVRGGISGPFSMASKLLPEETLLTATMMHPDELVPLLGFCTGTIKVYAKALAQTGAGVIVFDSFAAPPMISPEVYRELILPFHRDIMMSLEQQGVLQRSLIIGGNTLPIVRDLVDCGATQLLLDYPIALDDVNQVLRDHPGMVFRVNLSPALFTGQNTRQLETEIEGLLAAVKDRRNLIIGTGILSPDVPVSHLLFARKKIIDHYA